MTSAEGAEGPISITRRQMDEFVDSSSLTGRCPYCNAEEIVDEFPSASQRFSVYKFMCGFRIS